MHPVRLVAAALAGLLLVLMAGSLPNSRRDLSTVGVWLKGPERPGASHPRPLPLDVYRTPRGIEVIAAGGTAPESGVLLAVHLTTAAHQRSGFLFPTREALTHHVWGGDELSKSERAQLVSMAVACLRAQGMGEMVSEQLERGELSRSRVLARGYLLNSAFAMLLAFVAWQAWCVLRSRLTKQQRPASSASLRSLEREKRSDSCREWVNPPAP